MRITQLGKNVLATFGSQAVVLLLSFVATHVLFARLGAEVLGIANFALLITSFLISFFDLGLSIAASREIAAHRVHDEQYAVKTIRFLGGMTLASFLISVFCIVVFSPFLIARWLHVETINTQTTGLVAFMLMSVGLLFGMFRTYFSVVLGGYDRVDRAQYGGIFFSLLQQAGVIIFSYGTKSLFFVSAWYLLSGIASAFVFAILAYYTVGRVVFSPSFDVTFFLRNRFFIVQNFLNGCLSPLLYSFDKWMISRFLPVVDLGYYGTMQGIAAKGSLLSGSVVSPAFVALSARVEREPHEAWYSSYRKLHTSTILLGVVGAAAIFFFGKWVLGVILTPSIALGLERPLLFLCIGQALSSSLFIPNWLAVAQKRVELLTRTNAFSCVAALPLVGIAISKWGLSGAALLPSVLAIAQYVFFVPSFSHICLKKPPLLWYRETLGFLAAGGLIYTLAWVIPQTAGGTVMALGCSFALACVVYLWIFRSSLPDSLHALSQWGIRRLERI